MADTFLKIVNMSISAGWLALAVMALRLVLKRAPKWINTLLWGIVALRLVCPFSIESSLSMLPSSETIPANIAMDAAPTIDSGIPAIDSAVDPILLERFAPAPATSANPLQIVIFVLALIWAAGMAVMAAYAIISYIRLNKKLDTAILLRDNIYSSENVPSPFVLGIIRPRIYLPLNMAEQDIPHVIAHEETHIRRHDHWWKPLGFLLLTVHWFNPLMWLAYILLSRDIELACDERVIAALDNERRANYSAALLTCSVGRRSIAACPLAFGEAGVKERIKNVLNYKKPGFWLIIAAVVACAALAVFFLTDPPAKNYIKMSGQDYMGLHSIRYEFKLDKPALNGQVIAEHWRDNVCVDIIALKVDENAKLVSIHLNPYYENDTVAGMDIQLDRDDDLHAEIGRFLMREDRQAQGWAFNTRDKGEKLPVEADSDIALFSLLYDFGEGILCADLNALDSEPQRIANAEETIVVRAVFGDASDKFSERLTLNALTSYPENTENNPLSGLDLFRSVECLYMNPLSSFYPFDDNSGCRYYIGSDRLVIMNNANGDIIAASHVDRDYTPFTKEAFTSWFGGQNVNIPDISSYTDTAYFDIAENYRILNMDGELWIMERRNNPRMDDYVWSIYSIAPDAMGD